MEPTAVNSKKCKVCQYTKPVDEFSRNPNAVDGRNSICKDCRGTSHTTKRGRTRFLRERAGATIDVLVEQAFDLFKVGDPKKDFLVRQLLTIILTPGTNQQSQLRANEMLAEIHGLSKETPKSEEDLIHAAFTRMKLQADADAKE